MAKVRKLRERRRVPLRLGDVWIYLGPATEHRITALASRPTFQKPWSQAVTLDGNHTICEATLRSSYQRKQEYIAYLPILRAKWERAKSEFFGEPMPEGKVLQLRRPDRRG